jgi:CheY-like chemotaxis protein
MKKKVLIVDDEPFFVEVFTQKLGLAGFEVCSAQNGAEAVVKAKTEKPDLIIMDVMMPVMSGFDATQIIRNDPATRNIPIIIFTARGTFREFFEGVRGVELLIKTAGADAVIARVEALIGKPPPSVGELKRAVLLGVDSIVVEKVRILLKSFRYEVFHALNESEAVRMVEKLKPAMLLCQLWEDSGILDAPKIAQDLARNPAISRIPFYVYCKEALSVEAMKYFDLGNILTYKENSDLLKKLEILLRTKDTPA